VSSSSITTTALWLVSDIKRYLEPLTLRKINKQSYPVTEGSAGLVPIFSRDGNSVTNPAEINPDCGSWPLSAPRGGQKTANSSR